MQSCLLSFPTVMFHMHQPLVTCIVPSYSQNSYNSFIKMKSCGCSSPFYPKCQQGGSGVVSYLTSVCISLHQGDAFMWTGFHLPRGLPLGLYHGQEGWLSTPLTQAHSYIPVEERPSEGGHTHALVLPPNQCNATC